MVRVHGRPCTSTCSALLPFDVNDVNFGNAEYGRITGFKWLDAWMNGYRDGNEPYLPGWTISAQGRR